MDTRTRFILEWVSVETGVPTVEMLGRCQRRRVRRARAQAMRELQSRLGLSLDDLADLFTRDKGTVSRLLASERKVTR